MGNAIEYAKYLISKDVASASNTFDGNMRLQKLLVFSNLISLATRDVLLFDDQILAFEQGCVVEDVRKRYRDDYAQLIKESLNFVPPFDTSECATLDEAFSIFGQMSARELSELNHAFDFWKNTYEKSINSTNGFREKSNAVVDEHDMRKELEPVRDMLAAYANRSDSDEMKETINGVDFYYDPSELVFNDELISELYNFTKHAAMQSYSIYYDNGGLIIT